MGIGKGWQLVDAAERVQTAAGWAGLGGVVGADCTTRGYQGRLGWAGGQRCTGHILPTQSADHRIPGDDAGPRNYHNTAEHPASMLASLSAGTAAECRTPGTSRGSAARGNFDFIILGSQLPRSWALMSLEVVEDKFQALMVVNV